jgi:hypothetical protein
VAEQERELVVDFAGTVGQIGVAHTAGEYIHNNFTGSGVGDHDVHDHDRLADLAGNHSAHCLTHDVLLLLVSAPAGAFDRVALAATVGYCARGDQ